MACRVIRNNEGVIEQVLNTNGEQDTLFSSLVETVNNSSFDKLIDKPLVFNVDEDLLPDELASKLNLSMGDQYRISFADGTFQLQRADIEYDIETNEPDIPEGMSEADAMKYVAENTTTESTEVLTWTDITNDLSTEDIKQLMSVSGEMNPYSEERQIVSERGRNPEDPKEIALVLFAQRAIMEAPEITSTTITVDGVTYTPKQFANQTTYEQDLPLTSDQLHQLGELINKEGNDFVVRGSWNHPGWTALQNKGYAAWDNISQEWSYLAEDLNVIEDTFDTELDKAMKDFFKAAGMDYKSVSARTMGDNNALVDMTKMVVQVVEGRRNAYTLPEEAAHVMVAMMSDSELADLLTDIVTRSEYHEVKNEYNYTDENQIRREAIGKVVSKVLVGEKIQEPDTNIFKKLLRYLAMKLRKITGKFHKNVSGYSKIADRILNKNVSEIKDKRVYYQKSTVTQEEILREFARMTDMIAEEKVGNRYKIKGGNVIKNRVSDFVAIVKEKIYGNFASHDPAKKELAAKYGSMLHMYQEVLMKHVLDNINIDQEVVRSEVQSNLKTHPDFKNEETSFFDLAPSEFQALVRFTRSLHDRIMTRHPGSVIKLEQKIYNEATNEAGTMDLVAVHPNGSVSIYDYKFKFSRNFGPGTMNRLTHVDRAQYDAQIGRYKSHLQDVIGVTHFDETIIIPIGASIETGILRLSIPEFAGRSSTVERAPTLQPVAKQTIAALNDSFNTRLNKLMQERERLGERLRKEPLNENLKAQYYELDEAIINLQVFANPEGLLELLQLDIYRAVESMEQDDAIHSWVEVYKKLLVFEDMDKVFGQVIDLHQEYTGISDEDVADMKKRATQIVAEARVVLDNLVDMFIQWHEQHGTVKFSDPYRGKNGLSYLFDGIDEDSSPTHKRMREMLAALHMQSRREYEAVKAEMDQLYEAMRKEIGSLDQIVSDDGNLVHKVDKSLYEDMRAAENEGGDALKEWKQENMILNEDAFFYYRRKRSDGLIGNPNRDQIMQEFDETHDPSVNENAWITSKYLKIDYDNLNEKYISEDWKKIQDKENTVKYLERYSQLMYEWSIKSGKKFKGNFIPEISRSGMEKLFAVGLKGNFDSVVQSLQVREVDIEFGSNGEERVPFYFTDPLVVRLSQKDKDAIRNEIAAANPNMNDFEVEELAKQKIYEKEREAGLKIKTKDVHRAFLIFAEKTIEGINKRDIENSMLSLKYILSERGNEEQTDLYGETLLDQATNTVVKMLGVSNNTAERFDSLLNLHLYGKHLQGKDKKIGRYSGTKLVKLMMRYQGLKSVAFNPLIAAANAVNGFVSTNAFMKEGIYFDKKQLMESAAQWWKRDPKAISMLNYFYLSDEGSRFKSATAEELQNKASVNAAIRNLSMGNIYAMHRIPNEVISRVVFLSLMKNYYVTEDGNVKRIKNGETSIYDNFEIKDGKLELPEKFAGIIEGKINTLHHKVMNRITGHTTYEQRSKLSTTILGQVLMHFRNWLPGMAKARFQKYKYDDITDTLEVGRFSVLMEEVSKGWIAAGKQLSSILFREMAGTKLFSNIVYQDEEKIQDQINRLNKLHPGLNMKKEEFIQLKKAKLAGAAYELRMLAGVLLLVQLAAALDWDDDEASWGGWFAYRSLKRLALELSFFVNPMSVTEILEKPFVLLREVGNVSKILGNGLTETGEFLGIIEENNSDRTPFLHYTSKNIPFLNILLSYMRYYESRQEKEFIEYFMRA